MSPRSILPVPFGQGIDRYTGGPVLAPGQFQKLDNVHLYSGRMQMRQGLLTKFLFEWGTDVVAVCSVSAQGLTAAVVFDAVSLQVRLYLVDSTFSTPTLVGTLWTLNANAILPPSVIAVDAFDQIVIAHDEPTFAYRGVTWVLDANSLALTHLQAATVPGDATLRDVFFRGVYLYLAYLIGWGFGRSDIQSGDSSEIMRLSEQGQPTTFIDIHFFQVGVTGDAIIGISQAGTVLRIAKQSIAYPFFGTDATSFGVGPAMDEHYGQLGGRLAVTVNQENFHWTLTGPRSSTGGPSVDIGAGLDLDNDPNAPNNSGATRNFCFYDPVKQEVGFVFNDYGYILHLKDQPRRWSTRPYQTKVNCAGVIYTGGTAVPVVLPPSWSSPASIGFNVLSVAYHQPTDTFVAVGSNAPYVKYSLDGGQTWNNGTAPNGAWWRVRSNGTHLVMVDEFGNSASSTNGQTFVSETSAVGFNSGLALCWDEVGLVWVAAGNSGKIMTAPDAAPGSMVWTAQTGADMGNYNAAAAHGGTIVLGGDNHIQTSTNAGVTWAAQTPPLVGGHNVNIKSLVFFPAAGLFVGTGVDDTTLHGVVVNSTSGAGTSWNAQDAGLGNDAGLGGAAADATRTLAVLFPAGPTANYVTTDDGSSLVTRSLLANFTAYDVAYRQTPTRWVAVDGNATQFMFG